MQLIDVSLFIVGLYIDFGLGMLVLVAKNSKT